METEESSETPSLRVMIIDDQRVPRMAVGAFMEIEGCEVEYADSGEEAIEILRDRRSEFQVVFSDFIFPQGHFWGWETAQIVEHELLTPYFALLTGGAEYAEQKLRREGIKGIPVFEKPFMPEHIATVVSSLRHLLKPVLSSSEVVAV